MAAADASHGTEHAPWLQIPARAVAVVEHPCIVKNLDKGIVSLGGAVKLSQALRSKAEPENPDEKDPDKAHLKSAHFVTVSLRPDDPFAKRLLATPISTNNVLLKVTVPKRTGRKRKRGSQGPFLTEAEIDASRTEKATPSAPNSQFVTASTVFRSLKDNADRYTVAAVGVIDEAHRVRTLPDLQQATYQNRTLKEIKENLMPLKWSQLQNFNFKTAPGADLTQNIPLTAEFLQMPVQYNYKFQQNPFVKNTGDERETVNIQKRHTVESYFFIEMDAVSVPTKPRAELPPERTRSANLQEVIASIRAELNKRPIITRQILYNRLGWDKRDRIREAATYCGYFFASGPWREALIKWGVDPRKDPKYRDYQTISFLSFKKIGTARSRFRFDQHVRDLAKKSPDELQNEHIFDGKTVGHTGNIFQFCDITDPMIRKILDTDGVRSKCAPTFQGWYHVGTWAKATVILKDKMNRIIGGETPNPAIYARAMQWPATWDDQEIYETYRDEMFDRELHRELLDEHTLLNTIRWAAKSPRYAFERLESAKEKLKSANEAIGVDVERTAEAEVEAEAREGLAEERDDADALLDEGGEDAEGDDESGLEDEDEEGEDDEKDDEKDDEGHDEGHEEDEDGDEMDVDSDSDGGDGQAARPFGGLYGPK